MRPAVGAPWAAVAQQQLVPVLLDDVYGRAQGPVPASTESLDEIIARCVRHVTYGNRNDTRGDLVLITDRLLDECLTQRPQPRAHEALRVWLDSLCHPDLDSPPGYRGELSRRIGNMVDTSDSARYHRGPRLRLLTAVQREVVLSLRLHPMLALDGSVEGLSGDALFDNWVGMCSRLWREDGSSLNRAIPHMLQRALHDIHPTEAMWLLEPLWFVVAKKGDHDCKRMMAETSAALLPKATPGAHTSWVLDRMLQLMPLPADARSGASQIGSEAARHLLLEVIQHFAQHGAVQVLSHYLEPMLRAAQALLPDDAERVHETVQMWAEKWWFVDDVVRLLEQVKNQVSGQGRRA
jgi:hypothetical protein